MAALSCSGILGAGSLLKTWSKVFPRNHREVIESDIKKGPDKEPALGIKWLIITIEVNVSKSTLNTTPTLITLQQKENLFYAIFYTNCSPVHI